MWARIQSKCWPLLTSLMQRLQQYHDPRQIALGVATGAMLGLLPKVSLFALVLLGLMVRLRTNLAAGCASVAVFSVVRECCEPFLHRTGFLALTWQPLLPLWTWVYNLPLAAWTSFNNTVVLGGILAGAYLFLPLLILTHWLAERYQASWYQWIQQQRGRLNLWESCRAWSGQRR